MHERVHILLDAAEKERFRRWAEREGKSLSEWLREAAHAKLAASGEGRPLDSREALESSSKVATPVREARSRTGRRTVR